MAEPTPRAVAALMGAARARLDTSRICCDLCYEDGCDRITCPCLTEDATGTEQTCHDRSALADDLLRAALRRLEAAGG